MLYKIFSDITSAFLATAIGFALFVGVIIVFAKGREMAGKLFSNLKTRW